jgi:putative FmdB family regulatory protein
MPLYEYECGACGHRFEKIQKFSDPLEDTCPTCGGPVHKLMSSPAIQFKGSGFYITDYPKGDKGSAPKSDGGKKAAAEKAEASPKAEKSEKGEKGGSSSDTASTTASAPAASSTGAGTSSTTPAAPSPSSSSSTKD